MVIERNWKYPSWTDPWFSLICLNILSSGYVYWPLMLYYKHFYEAAQSNTCLSAKWSSGRLINLLICCTSVWKVCTWNFVFRILGFSKIQLFGIEVTFTLLCHIQKLWDLLLQLPSWQMFSCQTVVLHVSTACDRNWRHTFDFTMNFVM
jgi:hypothetical protein